MSDRKSPGRIRKDLRYPLPGVAALQGLGILGRRLSGLPEDLRKLVFVSSEQEMGEVEAAVLWFRKVAEHLAEVERERASLRTRSFVIGAWRSRPPFIEYPSRERRLGDSQASGRPEESPS